MLNRQTFKALPACEFINLTSLIGRQVLCGKYLEYLTIQNWPPGECVLFISTNYSNEFFVYIIIVRGLWL